MLCVTGRIYASLDDVQLRPPAGTCARCGGELYRYDDGEICAICKEELLDERATVATENYAYATKTGALNSGVAEFTV